MSKTVLRIEVSGGLYSRDVSRTSSGEGFIWTILIALPGWRCSVMFINDLIGFVMRIV
ncbi:hypothetical protein [Nitrosomonas sp. Nm33]|uniref:hypothetical protein n=1 Tax=Nitrosomonas sp. Nm33 TaxID=133724 RepID=UPI0015A432DF|nr:hypothetical protein [Nitrosomonas sp. Nm33]